MNEFKFDKIINIEIEGEKFRIVLTQRMREQIAKDGAVVASVGKEVSDAKDNSEAASKKVFDVLENAINGILGSGSYAKLTKGRKKDVEDALNLYQFILGELKLNAKE